LAANILPPAIKEFREHRPDLRIRLFDGNLSTVARPVAAGKLELGLGLFERMPGVRRAPFFRFSLLVIRPDKNAAFNRVSTRWTALNGHTLISLTSNYPHQQLIDKQLEKSGVVWNRGQTVNLLDTQIGLVEAVKLCVATPVLNLHPCQLAKRVFLSW
jgi:LysR family carnitine catabolism transcriptional activator